MRLNRLRWRLHGAWMWPTFLVLSVVDGALIHWRPPAGDSISAIGGWLLGLVVSLIAIVLLAPPLGMALRKLRGDMPKVVARDYAGAAAVVLVTVAFLAIGLAHRHIVTADTQALQDAAARAEAYIGDHAPTQYQTNLHRASVDPIQPPQIYRVCVSAKRGGTPYCVAVNRSRPFASSVTFSGHEPNALLELGLN